MPTDLAVLGRDPLFGGGGRAQTNAFLAGARMLGYRPELLFDPHPGLRGPRFTWRRVEALRQFAWSRQSLENHEGIWVVSTHATDGGPAMHGTHTFDAWIGTSVDAEFRGRAHGLPRPRRDSAAVSLPFLRSVERRVLRAARRLFATSPASRTEVAAASGRDDIGILPIPVDLEAFSPGEAWPPSRPNLLFVGRADDPRKNISLLLEVARRLPDISVTLVGTPPTIDLPGNVEALGVVDAVADAFRRATLFVLPSHQEGFGIAAAEALAAGIPVVTTPSGGPEDLVRRSGAGRVLGSFSPAELAETVSDLVGDTAELRRLRAAGREYVEREHSFCRFEARLAEALA